MGGISEYELGVLLSRMTPGSAGMILGRSARWVERRRAELAAPPEAQPKPPVATPVLASPAQPARPPLPAVSPRKLRFCRWFLAAGWSVAATADLFDLYPDELEVACG